MLEKVADFYESEVDATVKGLTSLLEPILIMFLVILVGGIVLCFMVPMFPSISLLRGLFNAGIPCHFAVLHWHAEVRKQPLGC